MRPLPDLPVIGALPKLREALASQKAAVLSAPPGSGKTTLVPLALLDEPWLRGGKIVMLEPRRLAARASAARMAQLRGERVGETVGYQVRFDRKVSAATRIEVITEGLLTRRLQSDPELTGTTLVIFDEFHERSLDVDLALALTLDARALNPELRVLVMSATLDTVAVASLLDGAPVVEASGRSFPVEIRHRKGATADELDAAVADAVGAALRETSGDVLAFLPGARTIRGAQRRLSGRTGDAQVMTLYGDMDSAAQDEVLRPPAGGRRRVILATNIAQTSLTIEGVSTIVDGGYARFARFDRGSGANRLVTQRISRAAADQRAGRAGRLGPGVCYRLWDADQHARLPAHDTPEILVSDLTRLALELAAWGTADPASLRWLDPPPALHWQQARALLVEIGALDEKGRITAHGRELARLPAAPRIGHMLLTARAQGLAALAARIAALLEERNALFESTDIAGRLTAVRGSRSGESAARRMRDAERQLLRLLEVEATDLIDEAAAGRVVSWAYPERIARRRGSQRGVYLCEDGGEARLDERDPLAAQEWLAIAHWDPAASGGTRRITLAAALEFDAMLADHAARTQWQSAFHWDDETATVVAEEQRRLGAIVLERRDARRTSPDAVAAAMLEGVQRLGLEALPWTEQAREWQARVASLRLWRQDENWPDVGDAALAASFHEWLKPYLNGMTRRDHLARLDLSEILNSLLDYRQQQALARLAPTHLSVPSGSRLPLRYDPPNAPVLEVKLQELFGLTQTPAVNDGRTPVMLHLLSPARRPIQVTRDLAGFWQRTYPEVRKELKGRYPRHPWPDDPLAALPTRRAKPRGT